MYKKCESLMIMMVSVGCWPFCFWPNSKCVFGLGKNGLAQTRDQMESWQDFGTSDIDKSRWQKLSRLEREMLIRLLSRCERKNKLMGE